MKVAALKNTDPWFSRMQQALSAGVVDATTVEAVEVTNTVAVDLVELEYDGPERGHRPWLHISGTLVSSEPHSKLPYGVEGLTFHSTPTQMDYRYDFTGEQIEQLREHKGLYTGQAAIDPVAVGIEWEMPGRMDLLMIAPQTMDDPVMVFSQIHNQSDARVDWDSSQYDLAGYFLDRDTPQPGVEADQMYDPARERSDELDDLFAHEPLDAEAARYEQSRDRADSADLDFEDDEFEQDETEAGQTGDRDAERSGAVSEEFEQALARSEQVRAERAEQMRKELEQLSGSEARSRYIEQMLPLLEGTADPVEGSLDPVDESEFDEVELDDTVDEAQARQEAHLRKARASMARQAALAEQAQGDREKPKPSEAGKSTDIDFE